MWQVQDLKKLDHHTLKGSFSLVIGPMTIEGWTFHIKNEKRWVNPPSKEYLDKETGEKKYWPIVRIEDKVRYWKFQDWCKEQLGGVFSEPEQMPETQPEQAGYENDSIPF